MPGFNQRGPMNEGPMTGRGMGQCGGTYTQETGAPANMAWNAPGYGQGRGMGMGRRGGQNARQGMGRGMGRGAQMQMPPQAPPPTKASLAARAQQLEVELESIKNELKQMGSE